MSWSTCKRCNSLDIAMKADVSSKQAGEMLDVLNDAGFPPQDAASALLAYLKLRPGQEPGADAGRVVSVLGPRR